jgi:hemoglobin
VLSIFRNIDPEHVAAWLAETFGGPTTYTNEHGGYEHMLAKHRGLSLTDEQRTHWISRMLRTADEVGLPADPKLPGGIRRLPGVGNPARGYEQFPNAEVMEHAPVPQWSWGQSPPYVPQPWDNPDAARRGRQRYDALHKNQEPAADPPDRTTAAGSVQLTALSLFRLCRSFGGDGACCDVRMSPVRS